MTLLNPSGVPRRFYVAIISASKTSLNSAYALSFGSHPPTVRATRAQLPATPLSVSTTRNASPRR